MQQWSSVQLVLISIRNAHPPPCLHLTSRTVTMAKGQVSDAGDIKKIYSRVNLNTECLRLNSDTRCMHMRAGNTNATSIIGL